MLVCILLQMLLLHLQLFWFGVSASFTCPLFYNLAIFRAKSGVIMIHRKNDFSAFQWCLPIDVRSMEVDPSPVLGSLRMVQRIFWLNPRDKSTHSFHLT